MNYIKSNGYIRDRIYISSKLSTENLQKAIYQNHSEQKGAGVRCYGHLAGSILESLGVATKIKLNNKSIYLNNQSLCKFVIRTAELKSGMTGAEAARKLHKLYQNYQKTGYFDYKLKFVNHSLDSFKPDIDIKIILERLNEVVVNPLNQQPLPHVGKSCYINTAMQIITYFEPLKNAVAQNPDAMKILDMIRSTQPADPIKFVNLLKNLNKHNPINIDIKGNHVGQGGDVMELLNNLIPYSDMEFMYRYQPPSKHINLGIPLQITKLQVVPAKSKPQPVPVKSDVILIKPAELGSLHNVQPRLMINGQYYRLEVAVMRRNGNHTFACIRNKQNQLVPLDDMNRHRPLIDANNNKTLDSPFKDGSTPFICIYVKE